MATTRRTWVLKAIAMGGLALASAACGGTSSTGQGAASGAKPPAAHKPEVLRVYILVVPDDVIGGGGHEGTPLTDAELRQAEVFVRQNERKFDIKPTSIIVVRGQPASFHKNRLIRHNPAGERETVLKVWTESDLIEWQSDRPFEITKIEKAEAPAVAISSAPKDPFYTGMPYAGARVGETSFQIQSSKLMASANGQQYKISLRIGGRVIDPDIICGSPPPGS